MPSCKSPSAHGSAFERSRSSGRRFACAFPESASRLDALSSSLVTEEEALCGPATPSDAGRTPATELRSNHDEAIPADHRRVRRLLRSTNREARTERYSRLSGAPVSRSETVIQDRTTACRGASLLVCEDAEAGIHAGVHPVSEGRTAIAHHSQSGRGDATHKSGGFIDASRDVDDAVRNGYATHRSSNAEGRRHR